jgi:hypothetical protein
MTKRISRSKPRKKKALSHITGHKHFPTFIAIISLSCLLLVALVIISANKPSAVYADSNSVNFESPTYTIGSINGQDGWTSTGSAGSGCALYDQAVASQSVYPTFGHQSFRISDAVTSGCFGDQTFAKPLVDSVGETAATAGSFPAGNRQRHFEMQFDIASVVPTAQQPGLHVSVSPDRGDGSRMSYLRFEDGVAGLDVYFDDVEGASNPANFVETQIATGLNRAVPHHVKLTMDTPDGPSNDVVKVYIDGNLVQTGTSWENYYRYDSESSAEQSPRIVRTVIFRSSGDAVPADAGKGFYFDNLSLLSGALVMGPPTSKDQCKNGGWKTFTNPTFKNQGQCVDYVERHNHDNDHDNDHHNDDHGHHRREHNKHRD